MSVGIYFHPIDINFDIIARENQIVRIFIFFFYESYIFDSVSSFFFYVYGQFSMEGYRENVQYAQIILFFLLFLNINIKYNEMI